MPAQGKRYTQISKREMIDWGNNIELSQNITNPYTWHWKTKMYLVWQWITNMMNSLNNTIVYYAIRHQYGNISANTTLSVNDYRKVVYASGTITITLQAASSVDQERFCIKNIWSGTITVNGWGSNIENLAWWFWTSVTLSAWQSAKRHSANNRWYLIT